MLWPLTWTIITGTVPGVLLGAWLRRRDAALMPWLAYGITLFAFSDLLFAVHVPYGTFLHSAVALVPHAYVAGLVGIAAAVDAVAHRRTSWNAPRARRVFTAMVVAVVVVGGIAGTGITLRAWQTEMDIRAPIVAALTDVPAGDRVMSPDAGAYRYLAGRAGIVTPDDPLSVVEGALRAYGVRWLVLERDHMVPALRPVLEGTERPAWLSKPILVVPASGGSTTSGSDALGERSGPEGSAAPGASVVPAAASTLPRAALYAVCLEAADPRCAP